MVAINIETPSGKVVGAVGTDTLITLRRTWLNLAFNTKEPEIATQWYRAYQEVSAIWDKEMWDQVKDLCAQHKR